MSSPTLRSAMRRHFGVDLREILSQVIGTPSKVPETQKCLTNFHDSTSHKIIMVSMILKLLLLTTAGAAFSVSPRQTTAPIIDLGYAQYQGVFDPNTNVTNFRGVRYAAAPTGDLRWRAPQTPSSVSGVQQATTDPAPCPQASNGVSPTNPNENSLEKRQAPTESEDCLFLNVAFPGSDIPAQGLPTVVWIHGGGYIRGNATQFQASDLVREANNGVVVVVIQYRLGLFGFLSGNEVKKNGVLNAGLLDQNFALRWVHDHISKFGGDPTKVTIWGQSAGAGSVLQHVIAEDGQTSPQLFRGAIASSTFLPSQYDFNDTIPETLFNEVVSQTNCSLSTDTLRCLRAASSSVLQAANMNINLAGFFGTFVFVPVIDGTFITRRATEALSQGNLNGQALMAMANTNEGVNYVNQSAPANVTSFAGLLFPKFGPEQEATVTQLYSEQGTQLDQENRVVAEVIFICPTYFIANAFGNRSFKGQFAVPPALHGDDVNYYFPTGRTPSFNNTDFQKALSESYLAFVISLDPNAKFDSNITPEWNKFSDGQSEMLFNKTSANAPDVRVITTDQALLERCRCVRPNSRDY
ncbi:hypothetical protein V5O48_014639 [Marasmius crinis-equi]|uniref:Carboxylic ester hydrolase n=1 Tax=Marasmius crinis-equi TaxID=585013 RepID=A0ABR3EWT7_9AGAR